MRTKVHSIAAVVVVGGFIASLAAAEKKIRRAQLPAAVERTVAAESRGATIKGFSTEKESGRTVYEVQLTAADGHGKDISMDALGNILEIEEEVSLASVPAAVETALTKAAGTGKVGKVESLTKQGRLVAYEAVVQTGTKHREVQVGPHGEKLAKPE